jgi:hypothetical protein
VGYSKGSPKRKVYSHESMSEKHSTISNKQPNATTQTHRKTRTSKFQNKEKDRHIRIRAKINEIESKKEKYKE